MTQSDCFVAFNGKARQVLVEVVMAGELGMKIQINEMVSELALDGEVIIQYYFEEVVVDKEMLSPLVLGHLLLSI